MLLYRASTFQTPAAWAPNYQNSMEYLDRLHVAVGARTSVGPAQMRSVSRVGPARRRSVSWVSPALRRSVSCVSPALRRSVSCVSPALRRSVSCVSPALRRSVSPWGWWGFFSKQRQILTRQISVHTGKFLEDFRKHGRGMGRGQGGPSSQPLPA